MYLHASSFYTHTTLLREIKDKNRRGMYHTHKLDNI